MNLIKTSLFTSVSTGISFLCGISLIKIVANKLGPDGIALFGQYQNVVSLFNVGATLAITVGVVKYLSENSNDKVYLNKLLNTALITVLVGGMTAGFFSIFFCDALSIHIFHTKDFASVFVLFGILLTISSLNIVFSSVFNGFREVKSLTIITIATSVINLIFIIILSKKFGLWGLLVASNFAAIFIFVLNLVLLRKRLKNHLSFSFSFSNFHFPILKKLLWYSSMSVATMILIPVNQFFIRDYIIQKEGLINAGYWQSMNKISDYYLLFITAAFGVYFLPVFSSIKNRFALKKEILNGYKIILPSVLVMSITIFFCRNLIIRVIFSPSFAPMENLFLFQLIGDFFKIGSWLLGYLIASKAMIKTVIITEVVSSVVIILLSRFFLLKFGIVGVTYAFALFYAIYWLFLAILVYNVFFSKKNNTLNKSLIF